MLNQKMLTAQELIKQKRYDEARAILENIDHPTAKKWLEKLDALDPQPSIGSLIEDKPKKKRDIIVEDDDPTAVLQKAKILIQQKHYDEARTLLEPLHNPTAERWLAKIDDLELGHSAGHTQVIVNSGGNPGCVVQVLWFLFIGWWVGQIWLGLAWLLMITIIGIPISIYMINRISKIIALRSPSQQTVVTVSGGNTTVEINAKKSQINLLVRIVYFFLVGWWLTGLWMQLAYVFCATLIGMPIGFWMFDKTPAVLSLQQ